MLDFKFHRPVKDVLMSSVALFEVPRTRRPSVGRVLGSWPGHRRVVLGTSNDAMEDINTSLTGLWN